MQLIREDPIKPDQLGTEFQLDRSDPIDLKKNESPLRCYFDVTLLLIVITKKLIFLTKIMLIIYLYIIYTYKILNF